MDKETNVPNPITPRPERTIRRPARYRDDTHPSAAAIDVGTLGIARMKPPTNPKSIGVARRGPHAAGWSTTHNAFIDRCLDLATWELVDPLPTDRPVGYLWAYQYNTDSDGNIEALSARCTARRDTMKAGVHYDPLCKSSQTPRHTARRLLFAE